MAKLGQTTLRGVAQYTVYKRASYSALNTTILLTQATHTNSLWLIIDCTYVCMYMVRLGYFGFIWILQRKSNQAPSVILPRRTEVEVTAISLCRLEWFSFSDIEY